MNDVEIGEGYEDKVSLSCSLQYSRLSNRTASLDTLLSDTFSEIPLPSLAVLIGYYDIVCTAYLVTQYTGNAITTS